MKNVGKTNIYPTPFLAWSSASKQKTLKDHLDKNYE